MTLEGLSARLIMWVADGTNGVRTSGDGANLFKEFWNSLDNNEQHGLAMVGGVLLIALCGGIVGLKNSRNGRLK